MIVSLYAISLHRGMVIGSHFPCLGESIPAEYPKSAACASLLVSNTMAAMPARSHIPIFESMILHKMHIPANSLSCLYYSIMRKQSIVNIKIILKSLLPSNILLFSPNFWLLSFVSHCFEGTRLDICFIFPMGSLETNCHSNPRDFQKRMKLFVRINLSNEQCRN